MRVFKLLDVLLQMMRICFDCSHLSKQAKECFTKIFQLFKALTSDNINSKLWFIENLNVINPMVSSSIFTVTLQLEDNYEECVILQ